MSAARSQRATAGAGPSRLGDLHVQCINVTRVGGLVDMGSAHPVPVPHGLLGLLVPILLGLLVPILLLILFILLIHILLKKGSGI